MRLSLTTFPVCDAIITTLPSHRRTDLSVAIQGSYCYATLSLRARFERLLSEIPYKPELSQLCSLGTTLSLMPRRSTVNRFLYPRYEAIPARLLQEVTAESKKPLWKDTSFRLGCRIHKVQDHSI
jgi:hypothetical protein